MKSEELEDLEERIETILDDLEWPELDDLCEQQWLLELLLNICKARRKELAGV